MRRALIVGIDAYPFSPLSGCVNDAVTMQNGLSRNEDEFPSFECKLLTAPDENITKSYLRENIEVLF